MKKLLFILLCCFGSAQLLAQRNIDLEKEIKPGAKLRYLITINDSMAYNFIVTVKKLTPAVEFNWEMDKEVPSAGSVLNSPKAMQSAIYLQNYFQEGKQKLDDKTVSVWLSKKLFNFFSISKGKITQVGLYGPGQPLVQMASDKNYTGSSVLFNGDVVNIKTISVYSKKKEGNKWKSDGEGSFSFYPSSKMPLIIYMKTKFVVSLEEINNQ